MTTRLATDSGSGATADGQRATRWRGQDEVDVLCVGLDGAEGTALTTRLAAVETTPPLSVETVDSGREALDRLTDPRASVSCLVTEYRLGDISGLDLLTTVREREMGLPVILLTGAGSEGVASRAISAGVTDYIRPSELESGVETLAHRITNAVSRYRAEREARRGYEAMETAQEGISLLDADQRFVYVNERYADIYGYDREELLGENWEMLYPEEALPTVRETIGPALAEEGQWSGETVGKRADGEVFPEQHSLTVGEDGSLVCVVRDITERKRREREQREREQSLRDLSDVIASTDRSFAEKGEQFLELGRERLDVETGVLTRQREDSFEFVQTSGADDGVDVGTTTPVATQRYCRQVMADGETVTVSDAEAAGWVDDDRYREHGVHCYAGTEVTVGGETFGTICFVDREPRPEPFSDADRTFLDLLGQCVGYELERDRRESHLRTLNGLTRDLMDAETVTDVCAKVVDVASAGLDLPVTAMARYDTGDGSLDVAAATEEGRALLDAADVLDIGTGIGWEAFIEGEPRTERPDAEPVADLDRQVGEIVAVPVGTDGVFVTAATACDRFSSATRELVETVVATAKVSLDRADREQQLHEREQRLAEQNERLERLNRINDTIRGIDRALVSASSRAEIEAVVCEQLVDAGSYELAWIGEPDSATDTVTPREQAGDDGFLDTIECRLGPSQTESGPVGEAVRTREPQVVNSILDGPDDGPWRGAALTSGFHACIALPLVYEGSHYGVLTVYAGQPGVFDELEEAVVTELSDTIAHAINAVESKRALVSDRVTELEFDVSETDLSLVTLSRLAGCDVTVETLIPRDDGRLRGFLSARGCDTDAALAAADALPVSRLDLVATHEDGDETVALFDAVLTDDSLSATLAEHAGVLKRVRASDDAAWLTVHLVSDGTVREFVERFQSELPDAELVAQRSKARPRQSATEVYAAVVDALTDRQLEVLQTAYFSGYFETPRDRTGSEVAETLGITQPTFNHHLRTALRKVCELLLDDVSEVGAATRAGRE